MPDISDFIRRSRRSAKIAIAAPGTPGDFRRSRRSAYKIARCVAGFSQMRETLIKRLPKMSEDVTSFRRLNMKFSEDTSIGSLSNGDGDGNDNAAKQ